MALHVWKRWIVLACAWGAAAGGAAAGEPAWLLKAAAQGDTAKVLEQLKQGVPVDVRDGGGNTLLLATQGNHVDTARVLIDAGANVNAQNTRLDSAYLLAGAEGRLDILRMTLAHGANLKSTNRYGGTALIPACERGHVAVVRALLDAGIDVNHVDNLGWTGLLEAILFGDGGPRHQQIVRLLFERGANVNLADGRGVTPWSMHARAARRRSPTCWSLPAPDDFLEKPMTHEQHMREAVALARANVNEGGLPFGAVLVRNGEIVARAVNEVHTTNDPTAHAEMQAIRQGSHALATSDLTGAVMYASGHPCPMCFAAMHRCGIRAAYFAYSNEDGEAFGMSTAAMYAEIRRAPEAGELQLRPLKPAGEHGLYDAWQARQA